MQPWRRNLIFAFSAIVFAAGGYGISQAIHSPLFLVRVVEVADAQSEAPLDSAAIAKLASIPVGQVNLFDLDLKPVERRILASPWIKEVRLQKRFPQTLSIAVEFREPAALAQGEDGTLSYVDREGNIFAPATLAYHADLPILEGLHPSQSRALSGAVKILATWDKSPVGRQAQIASMSWDGDRGYRALVVYPLKKAGFSRTWVDLGDFDQAKSSETQLARLSQVVHYLSENALSARQIWADAGKKIVVKTAHGS